MIYHVFENGRVWKIVFERIELLLDIPRKPALVDSGEILGAFQDVIDFILKYQLAIVDSLLGCLVHVAFIIYRLLPLEFFVEDFVANALCKSVFVLT